MNKRIVHICQDDKFIQLAYKQFNESKPCENKFYVFVKDVESNLKHINFENEKINFEFIKKNSFIKILYNYDLIVIHFLDKRFYPLINLKNRPPILWIGWGGDYYFLIQNLQLHKPITKFTFIPFYYNYLKKIKKIVSYKKIKKERKLLNKIDFFSPVLKEDYDLIKNNNHNFSPKYLDWNYGNVESLVGSYYKQKKISLGDKLLIGNSATNTNNHLDIFNILTGLEKELDVVLPLNYGDMKYAEIISKKAKDLFGNRVEVIEEFLPYDIYLNKLLECSNVIMGQVRQQALGNILISLYFGAKIFFFSDSVVFNFFKKKGVKVYEVTDLIREPELLDERLTENEIGLHREILISIWGDEIIKKKTEEVIKLIS